ncbi:MAG: 6-phosphofructokinase, partial [Bacteroidota bacterium]
IPLPAGIPTFGFNTAKNEGVIIGNTIYEDARTSNNWFVVSAMGRSAGHLAFDIGASCHFPMIILPEMFNKTEITFEKIINLVISSIIARRIDGIEYGVAMVSEGVFHSLSDEQIRNCGIDFTYDEHGHPELGNVSKAHIFNILLQRQLKEIGLKVKSRPVELGYELRCARPIAYDLTLCTRLGMGVKKLYNEGHSGCIVCADNEGNIAPLFLSDIEDKNSGKILPRLVDIHSDYVQMILHDLHCLTPADYAAAREYVDIPETYDFYRILNWAYDPAMRRPE